MVAHASVASSKAKVEVDSHSDTCLVDGNGLVIHGHIRPVTIYSYNPKDDHISAKTLDAIVGYQDPQSGQKYIRIIHQAIHINGLKNHLICPLHCNLSVVDIIEVT